MPVLGSSALNSSLKADKPPADAPIPTTGNGSDGGVEREPGGSRRLAIPPLNATASREETHYSG
jgi:hypothetical protein